MPMKILFTLLVTLAMLLLAHCGGGEAPPESPPAEPAEAVEAPPVAEPEPEPEIEAKTEPEPPPPPEPTGPQRVRMETSKGTILIELYPDDAPETVRNFLQYVDDKFYNRTIFHRVIDGFMIQGGGFTATMRKKSTRPPIQNEAGELANLRYTIAMARTPAPHSATAQFFINHRTNRGLDKANAKDNWGYCVFGKVIEGTDVVDEIAKVQTGMKDGLQDVPTMPVLIRSVERVG